MRSSISNNQDNCRPRQDYYRKVVGANDEITRSKFSGETHGFGSQDTLQSAATNSSFRMYTDESEDDQKITEIDDWKITETPKNQELNMSFQEANGSKFDVESQMAKIQSKNESSRVEIETSLPSMSNVDMTTSEMQEELGSELEPQSPEDPSADWSDYVDCLSDYANSTGLFLVVAFAVFVRRLFL